MDKKVYLFSVILIVLIGIVCLFFLKSKNNKQGGDVQIQNEISDDKLSLVDDRDMLDIAKLIGAEHLEYYKIQMKLVANSEGMVHKNIYRNVLVSGYKYEFQGDNLLIEVYVNKDFEQSNIVDEANLQFVRAILSANEYIGAAREGRRPDYKVAMKGALDIWKSIRKKNIYLIGNE